jgi:hypothetical protein
VADGQPEAVREFELGQRISGARGTPGFGAGRTPKQTLRGGCVIIPVLKSYVANVSDAQVPAVRPMFSEVSAFL